MLRVPGGCRVRLVSKRSSSHVHVGHTGADEEGGYVFKMQVDGNLECKGSGGLCRQEAEAPDPLPM